MMSGEGVLAIDNFFRVATHADWYWSGHGSIVERNSVRQARAGCRQEQIPRSSSPRFDAAPGGSE
jgi:hypothetical protein